jgi:hypothetical protein
VTLTKGTCCEQGLIVILCSCFMQLVDVRMRVETPFSITGAKMHRI